MQETELMASPHAAAGRGAWRSAAASGVRAGAAASAGYGIVTAAGIASMNPLSFTDVLLVCLYLAAASFILMAPCGIVLAALIRAARLERRLGAGSRTAVVAAVLLATVVLLYVMAWLHVAYLPDHTDLARFGMALVLFPAALFAAVVAALVAAALAVERLAHRALRVRDGRARWAFAAAAVSASLVVAAFAAEPRRSWSPGEGGVPLARVDDSAAQARLLVIGADALSWNVAGPLIERGEMPHLARILAEGHGMSLEAKPSHLTPVIWTTIATGRPPEEHGVDDFTHTSLAGLSRSYATLSVPPFVGVHEIERTAERLGLARITALDATDRKAPAFWEIAARAGLRSALIGYPVTWPAAPVEGVTIVSDRAFVEDLEARTTPDVAHAVVDAAFHGAGEAGAGPFAAEDVVASSVVADSARIAIAQEIFRMRAHDLVVVYLNLLDAAGHLYWGFHEPDELLAPPSEEERARRGNLVEEAYRRVDAEIGVLREAAGESVSVVVLSDHGMRAQPRVKWLAYRRLRDGGHHNGPPGVWIASGASFVRDGCFEGTANALDVLPTFLTALGVPLARDLRGEARAELLDPGVLRQAAPAVASYGPRPAARKAPGSREADEEMRRRIRGLGYVN